MRATKVRSIIGAIVALVLVVLVLSIISVYAGWNIPVLREIAGFIGVRKS
ncbi:MAG: hypothetical protein IT368_00390 [Candidatus Hydrogenedentes bacterium]|nr:hypothetical protein [Candidatus Hydrogenedentota bacterium]